MPVRLRRPDRRARAGASGPAIVLAVLLLASGAAAPGTAPGSAGVRFGIEELNTSGQVGEATFFPSGRATKVAIRIMGSSGRPESVGIYSAKVCTSSRVGRRRYHLTPLSGAGFSTSTVHVSLGKLRSGSYNVVVLASTKTRARPVACGHLY